MSAGCQRAYPRRVRSSGMLPAAHYEIWDNSRNTLENMRQHQLLPFLFWLSHRSCMKHRRKAVAAATALQVSPYRNASRLARLANAREVPAARTETETSAVSCAASSSLCTSAPWSSLTKVNLPRIASKSTVMRSPSWICSVAKQIGNGEHQMALNGALQVARPELDVRAFAQQEVPRLHSAVKHELPPVGSVNDALLHADQVRYQGFSPGSRG